MSDKSKIEWTEATWNPVYGCTKVSPGCANCYIERTPPYRVAGLRFERGAIPVQLKPERLDQPLRWQRPRRVFVNSLSDLFHENVPFEFIDHVFAAMAAVPQHTFQVLTKRPRRMLEYMTAVAADGSDDGGEGYQGAHFRVDCLAARLEAKKYNQPLKWRLEGDPIEWPLPNVWLGVTCENQRWANERIPLLLETPAAVRFVSCEPLLGPVDLTRLVWPDRGAVLLSTLTVPPRLNALRGYSDNGRHTRLDWVIVGGESAGSRARRLVYWETGGESEVPGWEPKPQALAWVRSIRDQCLNAGVPFFFKQWGGPRPDSGGRALDGRIWDDREVRV
jgi:protein gp37